MYAVRPTGGDDVHNGQPPQFRLECLGSTDLSTDVLGELEALYAHSYHNSHMYERFVEDWALQPEVFRLFLVRDEAAEGRVVGARVIESKHHTFVDYLGFPPIHGKRFCVAPEQRGQRIGQHIVAACNSYVFEELHLLVIFGESNEVGALAMHGREGALYLADSIVRHFPRNDRESAIRCFAEYLRNRRLRELRLPVGDGVQFVYCRDKSTTRIFREHGYLTKNELLAKSG
jgi:GNAT superfamily N-acetyltransferase